MKQSYNNPMITFDEVVDALNSIIDCSIENNEQENNYLNIKYESGIDETIDYKEEKLLYNALKELQNSLNLYSKIVRNDLENELLKINEDINCIKIDYLMGQEKRKLSAQATSIEKLKNASLDMNILYKIPNGNNIFDELEEDSYDIEIIDTNKVFSEFEQKVISDFPGFFNIDSKEEKDDIFDNIDIEIMDTTKNHEYNEIENIDEENDKKKDFERLIMIEKALKKARELNRQDLVEKLEKMYNNETI